MRGSPPVVRDSACPGDIMGTSAGGAQASARPTQLPSSRKTCGVFAPRASLQPIRPLQSRQPPPADPLRVDRPGGVAYRNVGMYCRIPLEQAACRMLSPALCERLRWRCIPIRGKELAAMEASPLPTPDTENWAEQFDQALTVQRDRVRTFLAAQQQRLRQVEAALDEQLRQLADELAKSRKATHQAREDVQQRAEQLARETEAFTSIKADLSARRAEWEEIQQRVNQQQAALADRIERQQGQLDRRYEELSQRQPEIEAAEAELHRERCELEAARREYETQREQLAALQSRLETAQADLDAQRRRLADAEAQTESQRRHIARQFRTEHAAHLQELDRRKAELQRQRRSGAGRTSPPTRVGSAARSRIDRRVGIARRQVRPHRGVASTADRRSRGRSRGRCAADRTPGSRARHAAGKNGQHRAMPGRDPRAVGRGRTTAGRDALRRRPPTKGTTMTGAGTRWPWRTCAS